MNTTNIIEPTAQMAATRYLREQLAQGKTLARLLLQGLDLRQNSVSVLFPRALDTPELVEFEVGHLGATVASDERGETADRIFPVKDANSELVGIVHAALKDAESACFLENSVARAGDVCLRQAKSRVIAHGTDVYHLLFSADNTESKIFDAIREARQIPVFLGAIGRISPEAASSILNLKTVDAETLKNFADSVECTFAGAYDGEGYIVWRRKSI